MQAKDLDDRAVLRLVSKHSMPHPASVYAIEEEMPDVPYKVIRAKMKALIKRKLVDGCDCGCRGDFTLTEKGEALL